MGLPAGLQMLANERQMGFIYLDTLTRQLVDYEADRETYPTLASFAPKLADAIAAIPEDRPELLRIPKVIEVIPAPGTKDLAPGPYEIRVTFDLDMDRTSWSWMRGETGVFPELNGKPRWPDARTCVLPVRLEPGTRYWLGLNTGGGRMGFRSKAGVAVEPFAIELSTAGP